MPLSEPSNLVRNMLVSNTNPLVAITIVPKIRPSWLTMEIHRAMGVVIGRLRGNRRLVLTCRHAFFNLNADQDCFVGIRKQSPSRLKLVGAPIFDTDEESDIAFLVVQDTMNIRTEPLMVMSDDAVIPDASVLYNARNVSDGVYNLCAIEVSRQHPVRERSNEAIFVKYSDPMVWRTPSDNDSRIRQLDQEGWQRCRSFTMVSRPGFSGSPIWDDHLRFVGMDIRGSDQSNDPADGDVAICIPSSEIFLARERVYDQIQRLADE
jgi:Trypsin-like peptidase domain